MNLKDKRDLLKKKSNGLKGTIFRLEDNKKNYDKVIDLRTEKKDIDDLLTFYDRFMETSIKVGE